MRTYLSPLRLFLIAAAACTIAACGGSQDSRNEIPRPVQTEVTKVRQPRVAMLDGTTAAISYYQESRLPELVTLRYQLATGVSEIVARSEASSSFEPFHLSAVGNGIAILLHDGAFAQPVRGCAIRTVGGAQCTSFEPESRRILTATPAAAGQAIALYGDPSSLLERSYDSGFGWGASRPGPSLNLVQSIADPNRSLARWRDGSAFLVATMAQSIDAARYDVQQGAWLASETLGPQVDDGREPQIALHPAAPAGAPIAVWRSAQGVASSVWEPGPGWSAAASVPGSLNGSAPTVAMWPNGDVLVVWHTPAVIAARRVNGVWQPPEPLAGRAFGRTKIAVGVDDQGNAVAVWVGEVDLMSASYVAGEGWQTPSNVGALASQDDNFDVAMAPEGRALAVWARPAGGQDPGSRLAIAEVGPFALTLSAQRYTFGGDTLPLTIRFASAPTQATTISLSTNLPTGSISLPPSLPVAANQSEVTFNVPTNSVADFADGVIILAYGAVRVNRPVTLMPEPTAVALSVTPATVLGGEAATISLQVSPIYPVALNLQLESNNAVAPVPSQVTTSMTSSAVAVPVTTTTTTTAQTAVFTARFRNRSGTGSLLVNPTSLGQAVLTVTIAAQFGTVTSTPAGINNCNQTCTASYPIGTQVTLTPTPAPDHQFFAWEGDPDCSEGKLTMLTARTCRALFAPRDFPYPDGTGWTNIAGPMSLVQRNYVNPMPALALEGVIPIVAHLSKDTPTAVPQAYVQRLQGSNGIYIQIGSDSLNIDKLKAASEPAIAATNNGLPYVAWIEGSGAQQNLYVSRLMGGRLGEWESVGPLNTPLNYVAGSRASSPSIALDAELNPMVAWIEDGAVKFKRFNGTAWVQAQGGEGPASAGADRVRLSSVEAVVGVVTPSIAWTQGSGMNRALKVVHDFAFTPLETQVNPPSLRPLTEFGVLAFNGPTSTYVTWGDGTMPFTIRSQKWDGTAWANVGQVINNNPHPLVSLAMPRSTLAVAWNYRFTPNDTSHLGVSVYRNGWSLITAELVLPGDANIGPTPVELANLDSPIVVRVERNSLNEYIWWTLRYYRQ